MSIPNELVQGIVDIKTAIENKSADTPVVIPDREYPDELCEALGAIKSAIENSSGGGGDFALDVYDTPVMVINSSGSSISFSVICYSVGGETIYPHNSSLSNNQTFTTPDTVRYALVDGKVYITSSTNKEIMTNNTGTVEYVKVSASIYLYKITPAEGINKLTLTFSRNAHTYPES